MKNRLILIIFTAILSACAGQGDPRWERGAKFSAIQLGQASKTSVRELLGQPDETTHLSLRDMDVWGYRYKESGVWDSMMHIHFDKNGTVRELMSGPDPMYDERRGFFH
ncbi:outer membrane protein assembly factor BamE [Pseudoduganella violacea]|uniref:Outer membrane protein assembly factor BamE n=1 Tax=Pseudoduganella violacea TaxID=1715466 RepID=A0A7W5B8Y0_9BURK|nr:outer membrane protein assembly factor BamE [Pseudoduganella violacea]MBB3118708.1 hypothetical protein [Pseudoduganella violacea]